MNEYNQIKPIVIDKEMALKAKSAARHEVSKLLRNGEILTEEAARILGSIENQAHVGSKFYGMNLDGLREISATSLVEILSGNLKNYLSMDGLTRLPENLPQREVEIDEWEEPVIRVRHFCLNGLTELSENEIQFLRTIPVEHLELNSVISLPDKDGWRITQNHMPPFVELARLRQASCKILSNLVESVGLGGLNLNGLSSITVDQIKILSRIGCDYENGQLWLGIEDFGSDTVIVALAALEVYELRIDRLVNIGATAAKIISEIYEGNELGLDGIKFIEDNVFQILATGNISGIPDGQSPGTLSLNSLQTLTQNMARWLDGNELNLYLNGITEFSSEIAEILVHSKGTLTMKGLRHIDDHVAAIISRNPNVFRFSREVAVSDKARSMLGESIPTENALSDLAKKLAGGYE